jgi:hypothetical protein
MEAAEACVEEAEQESRSFGASSQLFFSFSSRQTRRCTIYQNVASASTNESASYFERAERLAPLSPTFLAKSSDLTLAQAAYSCRLPGRAAPSCANPVVRASMIKASHVTRARSSTRWTSNSPTGGKSAFGPSSLEVRAKTKFAVATVECECVCRMAGGGR